MLVLTLALTLATGVTYRPPVQAPIVDSFRPPACSWCPGNRGIDYATVPGTPVRAAADGVVTFAGRIGPDRYVTVAHADGLRTSYAFVAAVVVRPGERVAQGQVVAVAGAVFHFGVRRGTTYLDPLSLFAADRLVARLVPLDGHRAASAVHVARPGGAPGGWGSGAGSG